MTAEMESQINYPKYTINSMIHTTCYQVHLCIALTYLVIIFVPRPLVNSIVTLD